MTYNQPEQHSIMSVIMRMSSIGCSIKKKNIDIEKFEIKRAVSVTYHIIRDGHVFLD